MKIFHLYLGQMKNYIMYLHLKRFQMLHIAINQEIHFLTF
jgi:hypothetical protein